MGFCIAYAALLLSSQIVTELANKNVLILSACIIICIARSKQDEVKKKHLSVRTIKQIYFKLRH